MLVDLFARPRKGNSIWVTQSDTLRSVLYFENTKKCCQNKLFSILEERKNKQWLPQVWQNHRQLRRIGHIIPATT